jgi:hypothetical protein
MSATERNIEQMEAQIKEWGGRIESLVARAELAGENVRADYRRRLVDMKAQREDAHARLEAFKAAGSETWEAFREGIEASWKDLEIALKEIRHVEPPPKAPVRAAVPRPQPNHSTKVGAVPKAPVRHRGNNR